MKWTDAEREYSRHISAEPKAGRLLNCPSTMRFHQTLAEAVLRGDIWNRGVPAPEHFPSITIYVPALSSVAPLKLAFLDAAPSGATLLPRVHVLGDVEPLDMFAAFRAGMDPEAALGLLARALEIPPAFSDLERRLALTPLVLGSSANFVSIGESLGEQLFAKISPADALNIAGQIAALITESTTEDVDLSRLAKLAKAMDGNEQLAPRLLREVLSAWRSYKVKVNKIDAEERRHRLMLIEAEFIAGSNAPVIIAGSTGSVAATLNLMQAALARENGAVVLAGLDRNLDGESWEAVSRHHEHAQYGLQQLLAKLGIDRADIPDMQPRSGLKQDRGVFLSEALRPASTAGKWRDYLDQSAMQSRVPLGLSVLGLSLVETDNTQAEAETIALIIRETLEHPGKTAAIVSPDETLLARVRHSLSSWGIPFEASCSEKGNTFAARVAACAASGKAEDLLSLLRHAPAASANARRLLQLLDLGAFREMWRAHTIEAIPASLARTTLAASRRELSHPAMVRVREEEWHETSEFAERIVAIFAPLLRTPRSRMPFSEWLTAHRDVIIAFEVFLEGRAETAPLIADLAASAPPALPMTLADYAQFFGEAAKVVPEREPKCLHPRLFFSRPLDARLMSADVLVLASLNEGCWPRSPEPDPWLSRNDRAFLGLSPPERRVGQSAQDFASLAASAPHVVLTRSRMVNGSLARPSRWISRIKILADGTGFADGLKSPHPWQDWARLRRQPKDIRPAARPQPTPPLAARPRRLSVTAIENWFANPYGIYARHILKLVPLRRLEEGLGPREKGILVHTAMHSFFNENPNVSPVDSTAKLIEAFERAASEHGIDLGSVPFWPPRFARFAEWFAASDAERRRGVIAVASEVRGQYSLPSQNGDFLLTARADRVDLVQGGGVRIYDFKTSKNTADKSLRREAPQLALEGLLALEGAFDNLEPTSDIELAYIIATGGEPPGDTKPLKMPGDAIAKARAGLIKLVDRFDDPATPYQYAQRGIFADKNDYDPYAHLARVKEWSSAVDGEDDDE